MKHDAAIEINNLIWKNKSQVLIDIPELNIPKGFATALMGENGAGKSNLLKTIAGINLNYEGNVHFPYTTGFEDDIKRRFGYVGLNNYFLHSLNLKKLAHSNSLLYDDFNRDEFYTLCDEFGLTDRKKPIHKFSDGMRMKVALASVLARDARILLLDEPASNLDPIMRDKLCSLMRDFIDRGNGEKTILFSTHNITDMENVTDYAIIMAGCRIVEEGFVEDLKDKYISVKGELHEAEQAKPYLMDYRETAYGYEGLCVADDVDKLAGLDIATELPTLSQISIALMKIHTDTI